MAFNSQAKRVAIVDLVKNKIIKVSEQAAKGFVRTARFDWPEDVTLEIGATQEQIDALEEAKAFNRGEVAVLETGTDLTNEVKKEAQEAKEKAEQEEIKEEAAKKYPEPYRIVLENLTIRDLQVLAFENELNLEGVTLKGDIIKRIKEQLTANKNGGKQEDEHVENVEQGASQDNGQEEEEDNKE